MLRDEAGKLAQAIEERFNGAEGRSEDQRVTATVTPHSNQPKVTAPGAGRAVFAWYTVDLSAGGRSASLELDQARGLLEDLDPAWNLDRLFEAAGEHRGG